MREIKFRARHWETKEWHYSYDDDLSRFWENYENSVYEDVCEYVGLKDKNGKKIFEGDIVKDSYNTGTVELKTADIPNCCCSSWDVTGWFYANDKPLDVYVEIIGNIYENPELT